ncbi:MAG: hypothetical protein Q8Q09_04795 [Deltaproteobacteria bacterium]|nr:hypothetical protein [Deltaproteobacteria bacterium]
MARWSRAGVLLVGLALSCNPGGGGPRDGGDAGEGGYGTSRVYVRPPVPEGALLVETPEFAVGAGQEALYCYPSTITTDREITTRELHSYQLLGGHHLVLFYFERPVAVTAPHECTETEMSNLRFIGGGEESLEQALRLPDGVGVRIPRGAQLVLQSHYLNLEPQERQVKDALVIVPAREGSITQFADPMAVNDGAFEIPVGTPYGRTVSCDITAETRLLSVRGHTHEWGTRFRLELERASGARETLYDERGGLALKNNPPVHNFPLDQPLILRPGDRLLQSCDWLNTTTDTLLFPQEMCASLMYYMPARGFITCGTPVETRGAVDAGVRDASTDGGGNRGCTAPRAPGDPCVRTCHTGNEYGVGRYCTPGGNECDRTRAAPICSADHDPSRPASGWCLRPCATDANCGSGAVCVGDPGRAGCVPVDCRAAESTDGGATDAGMDASMDATTHD